MQFQILDLNLKPIHIVDEYRSAIWAARYQDLGDCELYVPATEEALRIYQKNFYIARDDDDMVCVIKRIELEVSPENGAYLVVTGQDVRWYLDQRIIWGTATNNGNLESYLRRLVDSSMIRPSDRNRRLKKANGGQLLQLGDIAGFQSASTEQTSFEVVGDKIREVCTAKNWGWRIRKDETVLKFELYKGTDRTASVRFSAMLGNLETSAYSDDETNLGNVALIGGEGEGPARKLQSYGSSASIYRSEKFVDARDLTSQISWTNLQTSYPRGRVVFDGGEWTYVVGTFRIAVIDDEHEDWLLAHFDGATTVTIDGARYVQANNVTVATLPSQKPKSGDNCTLVSAIYQTYMINRGAETLAEFGELLSFDGAVVPNQPFRYKKDYFLGDIVTVETEFGIRAEARIAEVIESEDENGYLIAPKLEYINVYEIPVVRDNLATEELVVITAEDGIPLTTEGE